MVERVLLASPRGYCAGVERAVETVEKALEHYGAPVYVRKQIVHNIHVVRDLEARGAIFVDEETEVPSGATVVYSAHGVAPTVHANSARLEHNVIDATCPLVTKVHVQATPLRGRRLHRDPDRPRGPRGGRRDDGRGAGRDDPRRRTWPRRRRSTCRPTRRIAYITQTTLSVDETSEIIAVLRRRFPQVYAPRKEDICYATSNRQWAVKEMLGRDRPPARARLEATRRTRTGSSTWPGPPASPAHLIDDETEIDERWLDGVRTVGISSGASAPERLVTRLCDWFRARGVEQIEPFQMVNEDVTFRLPVELRRELILAETQRSGHVHARVVIRRLGAIVRVRCTPELRQATAIFGASIRVDGDARPQASRLRSSSRARADRRRAAGSVSADPVGQLEPGVLAHRVDPVDQLVDPALERAARRRPRCRARP